MLKPETEYEKAIKIKLHGKILKTFEMAYPGWECDGTGWIIEYEGKRYVILTDHGTEIIADKSSLTQQIKLYERLIKQTKEAIKLIKHE
jgi:hypothetical protein